MQTPLLQALRRIARIVAETLDLKEVFERVAAVTTEAIPAEQMALIRIEENGNLVLHSFSGTLLTPPEPILMDDFSPAIGPGMDGVKRIDDVASVADPSFRIDRRILEDGYRSLLSAPLRKGGSAVGFVGLNSKTPSAFTTEHEVILASIADILSLALEHERLWSLDLVRRERLDAVDALLPMLAQVLDIREIFSQVSSVVKPFLPHDHLFLASANADRTVGRLEAYSGDLVVKMPMSAPLDERRRFPAGKDYQLVRDVERDFPGGVCDHTIAKEMGVRAFLRFPIYVEGLPDSTLNFMSKTPDQYSEDDVPVARRVADYISLALSHRRLAEEERRAALLEQRVEALTEQLESSIVMRRVVGRSEKWKAVLSQIARVAPTEATVLLTGESGTGKEVVARLIHRGSPRAKGPFVAINCAALPETLLESELFGHERGAFTGATRTRAGCIEQASRGILFLDEVGEMSPAVQAKLLRVIEEREFTRVGGARTIKADIRLVAATNRDIRAAVDHGLFRKDLYYRLRVFEIALPPLRERPEDILPLAEAFLEDMERTVARPSGGISRQVRDALLAYGWPGNIRELRNVLERATILCDGGLITLDHLPPEMSRGPRAANLKSVPESEGVGLAGAERALILRTLRQCNYNRSEAARRLGITRPTLYYKIQKHELAADLPHPQGAPRGKRLSIRKHLSDK